MADIVVVGSRPPLIDPGYDPAWSTYLHETYNPSVVINAIGKSMVNNPGVRKSNLAAGSALGIDLSDVEEYKYSVAGNTINLQFDNKTMIARDKAIAVNQLSGIFSKINAVSASLDPGDLADIRRITTVVVSSALGRPGTAESIGTFGIQTSELLKGSTWFWASNFVHDGHHVALFDVGGINASRGLAAEISSMDAQLRAAPILGVSQYEIQQLQAYRNDAAAMQARLTAPTEGTCKTCPVPTRP